MSAVNGVCAVMSANGEDCDGSEAADNAGATACGGVAGVLPSAPGITGGNDASRSASGIRAAASAAGSFAMTGASSVHWVSAANSHPNPPAISSRLTALLCSLSKISAKSTTCVGSSGGTRERVMGPAVALKPGRSNGRGSISGAAFSAWRANEAHSWRPIHRRRGLRGGPVCDAPRHAAGRPECQRP